MARIGRGFPARVVVSHPWGGPPPQTITTSGIASAEAFGSATVADVQVVVPSAIASAEALGWLFVHRPEDLFDDFADGSIGTRWTLIQGNVTETGGYAAIGDATTYGELDLGTSQPMDWAPLSEIVVESAASADPVSSAGFSVRYFYFVTPDVFAGEVGFYWAQGASDPELHAYTPDGDVALTYDPVAHRFQRILVSGGLVRLYVGNGSTWTQVTTTDKVPFADPVYGNAYAWFYGDTDDDYRLQTLYWRDAPDAKIWPEGRAGSRCSSASARVPP